MGTAPAASGSRSSQGIASLASRPMLELLEPRLLLSADLQGVVDPAHVEQQFKVYDLGMHEVNAFAWGDTIRVGCMIGNTGDTSISSWFETHFLLSTDATIDAQDYDLCSYLAANMGIEVGLQADKSTSWYQALHLPSAPPPGFVGVDRVYLGLWVDATGRIAEGSDANNYNQGVGIDKSGPLTVVNSVPRLSVTGISAAEGNSGVTTYFDFTVSLSKVWNQDVTVHYRTLNGTATTADQDYIGVTDQTVTILTGQRSAVARVLVKGDSKVEAENGRIKLSVPAGTSALYNGKTYNGPVEVDEELN